MRDPRRPNSLMITPPATKAIRMASTRPEDRGRRAGSRVWHARRPAHRETSPPTRRPDLLFLLRRLSREVCGRASEISSAPRHQQTSSVPEGTIYTCPMHPQIRQVGPGSCPICGMALEPVLATAEAGPNAELIDMSRRFWIGLVLSLPVVALEMGGHLTGLLHYVSQSTSNWIQMILGHAGRALGGLAVFRARLEFVAHAQSEHVHAHRDGNGRRLGLQRRRHSCARNISRQLSASAAVPSPFTSKPLP